MPVIPFGVTSGAINMNSLRDFFGDPTYNSNTLSMSQLYKGGDLVPNISQNSSVPTSGTISLSNLYGCHTSLQFDKQPVVKNIYEFGIQPTGTMQAQWVQSILVGSQGDFDVGYGALKNSGSMQYRAIITGANQLTRIVFQGNTYTTGSSTYTTPWLTGYGTTQLERDWYSSNSSFNITGTFRVEVRKTHNGTTYTQSSSTASWRLQKFNSIE